MSKKILSAALITGIAWAAPKVIGYLPNWSDYATFGKYAPDYTGLPSAQVLKEMTHAMAFSIWPNSTSAGGTVDGHLAQDALNPNVRFSALIDSAHKAGIKAMVVLGGWDSQGPATAAFCTIAKNSSYRALFASDIKKVVVNQGYDGIDIDWEHPTYNGCSFSDFKTLTKQIKDSLNTATTKAGAKPLFSMAVNPTFSSNMSSAGTSAEWLAIFDWINLMTYDSPFSSAPTTTYTYLNTWSSIVGGDMSKLTLGLPFYGWGSCGTGPNDSYYREIYNRSKTAGTPITATSNSYSGCTFNGIATTSKLVDSAIAKGAGAMIWDINQDLWIGDSLSQLRAVRNTINKRTGVSSMVALSSWAPSSSSAASSSSINYSSHTDYSCPSTWSKVTPTKTQAQNFYTSTKGVAYVATNATDGDTTTSWVGNLATDWLQLNFDQAYNLGKMDLSWINTLYRPAEFYIMSSMDSLSWDTVVTQHYVPSAKNASDSWTPVAAKYLRFQGISSLVGPIYMTETKAYVCGALPASSSSISNIGSSSSDNTPTLNPLKLATISNLAGHFVLQVPQAAQVELKIYDAQGKLRQNISGYYKAGSTLLDLNIGSGSWNAELHSQGKTQKFTLVQP